MRLVRRGLITSARNGNAGMKKERRYDPKQPKNYAFMRREKMFHVKHKGRYYGCFKKEKDAQKFVELMRECNWDKSKSKELKEKVLKE